MVGRGRGVVRNKSRGRPSSSHAGSRGGLRAPFVASTNDNHLDTRHHFAVTQPSFSLSEEARNTEHYTKWNSDVQLRHSRVAFISAGQSTAEDRNRVLEENKISDTATESLFHQESIASVKVSEKQSTAHAVTPDARMLNMALVDLQTTPAPQVKSGEGFNSMFKRQGFESAEACNENNLIDRTDVKESVRTGLGTPKMRRSPSPTGSDLSGEIIVFAGRRRSCDKRHQNHISDVRSRNLDTQSVSKASECRTSMATVIDDPIWVEAQNIHSSTQYRQSRFTPPNPEVPPDHLSCRMRATATKSERRRQRRSTRKEKQDEGILDDYIANLRDGGDLQAFAETSVLNRRDLDISGSVDCQDDVSSFTMERSENSPLMNSEEWDSADLKDFDELSTSNEVLESIEQVLSKRERPSGVQYLVLGTGYTIDEARWIPVSILNIHGAEDLIRDFEDSQKNDHVSDESDMSDASLTVDEQAAQDLQEELDDVEDGKNIEERCKSKLTDEQVARLLSKQEELGLGSDDLMLFDGGVFGTDRQEDFQVDGLWEQAVTQKAPSSSRKTKWSRSSLPPTTAFADAIDQDPYNGFDIMDHQRPSLRKTPKGRRRTLPIELSDSELEQSIHTAWEKDRTKKKMWKQEREELRAQGLLGKKNKIDLKAKYSEGISMTEVKNEIKNFLLSSKESLPLPPMAQKERKIVHEIANVFKLKSKSTGGGKSRYPILYRTSRTRLHNEETLKAAESVLSSGRFLPRMDRGKMKGVQVGRSRGRGAASAGVSYRDGEVVGAAAPEIGLENRGRTMLERMGWSTGTALGALNNSRGLVQPVAQVVKTSRSGLG